LTVNCTIPIAFRYEKTADSGFGKTQPLLNWVFKIAFKNPVCLTQLKTNLDFAFKLCHP
jgi:hypothetical protein